MLSSCKAMNWPWTGANSHVCLSNVNMELQNKYPRTTGCGGEKRTTKKTKEIPLSAILSPLRACCIAAAFQGKITTDR